MKKDKRMLYTLFTVYGIFCIYLLLFKNGSYNGNLKDYLIALSIVISSSMMWYNGLHVSIDKSSMEKKEDESTEKKQVILDKKAGLEYSGGDPDLYGEVLEEFLIGIPQKIESIEKALREENWKVYTIEVHALKSSARLIGATGLSDLAKKCEDYGKQMNITEIVRNTPKLIAQYQEISKILINEKEVIAKKTEEKMSVTFSNLDRTEIGEIVANLNKHLEDFDVSGAEELVVSLGKFPFEGESLEHYQEMKQAIHDFDYELCSKASYRLLTYL